MIGAQEDVAPIVALALMVAEMAAWADAQGFKQSPSFGVALDVLELYFNARRPGIPFSEFMQYTEAKHRALAKLKLMAGSAPAANADDGNPAK